MADIRRKGKVSIGPGQPPKDAELIDISKAEERWSIYELDDGTQVRSRPTVIEAWRVIDEYDAEGNPLYIMKAQVITSIIAPENLKRGKK